MTFSGRISEIGDIKIKSSLYEKVVKRQRSKSVVMCISQSEYDQFILPYFNNNENKLPYNLEFCDSNLNIDDLVNQLNLNASEVLLTAWSSKPIPSDICSRVPTLRYISHITGTVRSIIPRNIIEQGIIVTNWGDSIARTVAEHCLLQIIASLRRAALWQLEMHIRKNWRTSKFETSTLFGKKVGLHGFGVCARELVKLLKPFDCQISSFSPSVPDSIYNEFGVLRYKSLEDIFSKNEIIVDLAALTPTTQGVVTEKLLRMIPEGGVFVNSGRGKVIDEEGLCRIAKEGKIQIALDVFATEPLPAESPLRSCDNVFLTPHIGGPTIDERKVCGFNALKNICSYFQGLPLQSIIGLEEYDRMT